MNIIHLSESEFDNFSKNHKYRTFYQTSSYGKLMEKCGFKVDYLGFKNNQEDLVGATLLLYHKAFWHYNKFLYFHLLSDILFLALALRLEN